MNTNDFETVSGTGNCTKCGGLRVQMGDGVARCLLHEVPENPPSGKVVSVKDPGHSGMIDILQKSGVKGVLVRQDPVENVKAVPLAATISSNSVALEIDLDLLEEGGFVHAIMTRVSEALDGMPFSTMREAKRVMKIQEKIEKFLKGA